MKIFVRVGAGLQTVWLVLSLRCKERVAHQLCLPSSLPSRRPNPSACYSPVRRVRRAKLSEIPEERIRIGFTLALVMILRERERERRAK